MFTPKVHKLFNEVQTELYFFYYNSSAHFRGVLYSFLVIKCLFANICLHPKYISYSTKSKLNNIKKNIIQDTNFRTNQNFFICEVPISQHSFTPKVHKLFNEVQTELYFFYYNSSAHFRGVLYSFLVIKCLFANICLHPKYISYSTKSKLNNIKKNIIQDTNFRTNQNFFICEVPISQHSFTPKVHKLFNEVQTELYFFYYNSSAHFRGVLYSFLVIKCLFANICLHP
ncbi:hypothetical protein ACBT_0165 [Aliarcobacter cibarius]|uniref:Uncharacterized protein n=1 Tax=Aliarcobacter cibarius TaxID=255507 RepID=A0A7L5JM01_9BACT|nr:hypothetical protein ACBT_0165 [Aliarcobacter cibarius]